MLIVAEIDIIATIMQIVIIKEIIIIKKMVDLIGKIKITSLGKTKIHNKKPVALMATDKIEGSVVVHVVILIAQTNQISKEKLIMNKKDLLFLKPKKILQCFQNQVFLQHKNAFLTKNEIMTSVIVI